MMMKTIKQLIILNGNNGSYRFIVGAKGDVGGTVLEIKQFEKNEFMVYFSNGEKASIISENTITIM